MSINNTVVVAEANVSNNASLTGAGSEADSGAWIATECGGTGDATIYRECDPAGTGAWDVSIQI